MNQIVITSKLDFRNRKVWEKGPNVFDIPLLLLLMHFKIDMFGTVAKRVRKLPKYASDALRHPEQPGQLDVAACSSL